MFLYQLKIYFAVIKLQQNKMQKIHQNWLTKIIICGIIPTNKKKAA